MNPHETNPNPAPSKLHSFVKSNARRVGLAVGLVLLGSVVAYASIDPLAKLHDLEEQYENTLIKRNQAVEYYNIAQYKWCMTRVDLANEKLSLYYKDHLELTKHEMARLSNLIEAGCDPEGEAPGLIQDL